MNLNKLQGYIAEYKTFLQRDPRRNSMLYKWESLQHFQENWDLDAPDFAEMYDRILQNSQTRRIWKRENYDAKGMMLKFIKMAPDFVRDMFKDLFFEERDIVGRVDRFVFHCDELLREYKEQNPRSIENNHFHDDGYGMVSWYLSFKYPELYAPHNFAAFQQLLQMLATRDVPQTADFGRFCKVARTLYKMLEKDDEVLEIHQNRLKHELLYQDKSLLVVEDFYLFTTAK